MRFDKIIGKTNSPRILGVLRQAEDKLSACFTELSLSVENKSMGSNLGGDPLIFTLIYTTPHIADITGLILDEKEEEIKKKDLSENDLSEEDKRFFEKMKGKILRTAATDGVRLYYNPEFISKLSRIGTRLVVFHEGMHSTFSHPNRRGSRHPGLYNISIDFKVNHLALEDLKARGIHDPEQIFKANLGDYITLAEYAALLKDPFNPPDRLAHLNPIHSLRSMVNPGYKHPGDNHPPMYYADAHLPDDMKRPENIYSYLFGMIPKCTKCGKLGVYKKPAEYNALKKQLDEKK